MRTTLRSGTLLGWCVFGSHMHGGIAGGVLVLVSPALARIYTTMRMDVVVRGRIVVLRLRAEGYMAIDIVNMHLVEAVNPPLHAQFAILRLSLSLSLSSCMCTFHMDW